MVEKMYMTRNRALEIIMLRTKLQREGVMIQGIPRKETYESGMTKDESDFLWDSIDNGRLCMADILWDISAGTRDKFGKRVSSLILEERIQRLKSDGEV